MKQVKLVKQDIKDIKRKKSFKWIKPCNQLFVENAVTVSPSFSYSISLLLIASRKSIYGAVLRRGFKLT